MKALIASDIHGNLEYTKKLDKLCDIENFDKIILLGDLLNNYYGSDSEEVNEIINILNKRMDKTIGVRGNCDSEWDIKRLLFPCSEEITFVELDGTKYYIEHGNKIEKYEYLTNGNYYFYGHTHIYNLEGMGLNPGSVGNPRRGLCHSVFIYNNGEILLIDLDNFTIIGQKSLKIR